MKFIDGKYLKKCAFIYCNQEFLGRLNKEYCSSQCKSAKETRIKKQVRAVANGDHQKINTALRILLEIFYADEDGFFYTDINELAFRGFPFDLPTTLIKLDGFGSQMHAFGCYCFARKNEKFTFYKYK